eukprot:jgi/Botrbrau1/10763/Bobra.180_2s0028.1
MATPLTPTLKWAQSADKLYATIDVQDCKAPKIELTNDEKGEHGKLVFRGEGAGASHSHEKDLYALDLTFCSAIDPDDTKIALNDRSIILVIQKKEDGFWPRLLADKQKFSNIQVDWDKWVDEDEEPTFDGREFDLNNLQNLSNFGADATELAEDEDSDDDEVPGLEAA